MALISRIGVLIVVSIRSSRRRRGATYVSLIHVNRKKKFTEVTLTGRRASRIWGAEDMIGKALETVGSPRFQVVCVVTCKCVDIGCVITEIEKVNDQKRMQKASHAYRIFSTLIGVFRSSSFCFFKIYSSSFARNLRIVCLSKYADPN